MTPPLGLAGRIARAFVTSRLTPLSMIAALLLGAVAIAVTSREEEPQIVVPMADVFIPFPGASAGEVEQQLTSPIERKISEIRRVEYVYSISRPGTAMIIVRFRVGEDLEKSLVDLYDKLMANQDLIPQGAGPFQVKPRDINDVPIVAVTLWSERYGDDELRRVADHVFEEIKKVPQTSGGFIAGGRSRRLRIELDPSRLAAHQLTPLDVAERVAGENQQRIVGSLQAGNREIVVEAGGFLGSRDAFENLVLRATRDGVVHLRDVAVVRDEAEDLTRYSWFGTGPAAENQAGAAPDAVFPAVTVAIAKQPGANAVSVSAEVIATVERLKGTVIPSEVHATVTRDYGATANEKSNELLEHLLIAVVAVVVFLGFALGVREAGVVALAIPLTLGLTLFASLLIGYTINRVTLFALIFAIGILVDDAIVVVENIYRHLRLGRQPPLQAAITAVDEVGNPTILATFTVIAALLPMAFISGLMGPYMRPIPINASIAMFASLLVAFIVVPWFCRVCHREGAATGEHHDESASVEDGKLYRIYQRVLTPLIARRGLRAMFFVVIVGLLFGSVWLFVNRSVVAKMLPFDNKSEFEIVIDMPEGTTLETTADAARALGRYVATIPEVTDYQIYAGTPAPFNFNGLVRHYFLREEPHQAEIQVNLVGKHERATQSHEIARRIRPEVERIARAHGVAAKIVEVPPGPPVQSVLVAEVYGPNEPVRREVAAEVAKAFADAPGVVDVDDTLEAERPKLVITVDQAKAAASGVATSDIVQALSLAVTGVPAGRMIDPREKEPIKAILRLPYEARTAMDSLLSVRLRAAGGGMVPISELVKVERPLEEPPRYHKNLRPVVYVTGDVGGREESPVYGMFAINERLTAQRAPDGSPIDLRYTAQPSSEDRVAVKWDGEWQITYETFRDMGIAFGIALVLIYLLIVGQFQSFLIPLVIMAPIPLTLVGVIPGHWLTGSYFTATSMIGFIALAGIVVRNSILLVDFIQAEQASGRSLTEAVLRAGAIRTRPILLTAAALIVGAFVIILDPIFQGLAISLLFGVVGSTLLTLVVIPVLYVTLAEVTGAGKSSG
ncbi:MAG: efflux RND transporter permease subunit [Nitrospirota bacterium]